MNTQEDYARISAEHDKRIEEKYNNKFGVHKAEKLVLKYECDSDDFETICDWEDTRIEREGRFREDDNIFTFTFKNKINGDLHKVVLLASEIEGLNKFYWGGVNKKDIEEMCSNNVKYWGEHLQSQIHYSIAFEIDYHSQFRPVNEDNYDDYSS